MKAADVKPGSTYLVGLGVSRRYQTEGKAVVVREATAADRDDPKHRGSLRGNRMASGSGHKLWLIRWTGAYRVSAYDRFEIGSETLVPTAWIRGPWTDEHEQEKHAEAAREAVAADLAKRLERALDGVSRADQRWTADGEPVFVVTGQKTDDPTFAFTKAAIEALLRQIERS